MECRSDLLKDPESGLLFPRQFVDEKQALKKLIDDLLDRVVSENSHIKENYFLNFHMKFDSNGLFTIDIPIISHKIPPFVTNQMVYWVSNSKSICEMLWMIPAKKKGEKIKPIFNQNGVAYLQAKGAMPS